MGRQEERVYGRMCGGEVLLKPESSLKGVLMMIRILEFGTKMPKEKSREVSTFKSESTGPRAALIF